MRSKMIFWSIFYTGFTLFVLLIMSLMTFPFISLEHRLEFTAREKYNIDLDLKGLNFDFPFAIKYEILKFSPAKKYLTPVILQQGRIELSLLNLILGKYVLYFKTRLNKGLLKGDLNLSTVIQPEKYELQLQWDNVLVHPCPSVLSSYNVSSFRIKTKGDLSSQGNLNKLLLSNGSGTFALTDSKLNMGLGTLPNQNLSLNSLEGSCCWELNQGRLELKDSSFKAQGLKGGFQGKILSLETMLKSRIDLKGTISFFPSFPNIYNLIKESFSNTHFQWSIKGRADQPLFSFSPK